ncbi:MAG: hypothetical protein QXV39_07955 [Candidatus Caldarchaeum sp.]
MEEYITKRDILRQLQRVEDLLDDAWNTLYDLESKGLTDAEEEICNRIYYKLDEIDLRPLLIKVRKWR